MAGGMDMRLAHELTHVVQQNGSRFQQIPPHVMEQVIQASNSVEQGGSTKIESKSSGEGIVHRKNRTGLPDQLKARIESVSGFSMDDVNVEYNSAKPAQLNALAYTQGQEIYVAPGQEKHLPHEAWHVVQQAQSRVKPTMQLRGGVPLNDDEGLENEANVMGARIMQCKKAATFSTAPAAAGGVIQGRFRVARKVFTEKKDVTDSRDKISENIPIRLRNAIPAEELIAFLEIWAADDANHGYFTSYYKLTEAAVAALQHKRIASQPVVPPQRVRTGRAQRYDSKRLQPREKIQKLRKLRRVPSIECLRHPQIRAFRDTTKPVRIKHRFHGVEYSIGHTSNFLLGGVQEHTYKELLSKAKTLSGFDDKILAQYLIRALTGEVGVINSVPEAARDYVVKILALVQGPEFRRAAMNLDSTVAALNTVVSSGGDIFDTLRQNALFVASEKETHGGAGGSMRSQFHRRAIAEDDEDFQQVAVNEFDSLMTLADTNDVDTTDDTAVETFFAGITQTAMEGIQEQFNLSV